MVVILRNELTKKTSILYGFPFSLYVMSVSMFSLLFYGLFHFTILYQEIFLKVCWHKNKLSHINIWNKQSNMESLPYCCEIDKASPLSLNC